MNCDLDNDPCGACCQQALSHALASMTPAAWETWLVLSSDSPTPVNLNDWRRTIAQHRLTIARVAIALSE